MNDDLKPGSKAAIKLGCSCSPAEVQVKEWGRVVRVIDMGCVLHSLSTPRVRDKKKLN